MSTDCPHSHLIPVEYVAGIRKYDKKDKVYVDWYNASIINANYLHVTKFFCPSCKKIIRIDPGTLKETTL